MTKSYRQTLEHQVSPAESGKTVKELLNKTLGLSNRSLQKLTRGNSILVNGKKTFLAKPLRAGDRLRVNWEETLPAVEPIDLALKIIHEDDLCLIVDKPAFTPVHPSPGWHGPTLVNGIAFYNQARGRQFGIHPVSRLDTNTTGLIVIAKHAIAHSLLEKAITSHSKTYQALVTGILTTRTGTIDAPIKSLPHAAKRLVKPDGQPAVTHYRVLQVWEDLKLSLIELKLETGRTHQIRVHMAHFGHPLLGDRLYGRSVAGQRSVSRYALHCSALKFTHPQTGDVIEVVSKFDVEQFTAQPYA